jgi:hypothetical protein
MLFYRRNLLILFPTHLIIRNDLSVVFLSLTHFIIHTTVSYRTFFFSKRTQKYLICFIRRAENIFFLYVVHAWWAVERRCRCFRLHSSIDHKDNDILRMKSARCRVKKYFFERKGWVYFIVLLLVKYLKKWYEEIFFLLLLGKRHFVLTFHYGLPEEMFVTISRHIKTCIIFRMTKVLNKQGVRNESCPIDRNGQQYFFRKKTLKFAWSSGRKWSKDCNNENMKIVMERGRMFVTMFMCTLFWEISNDSVACI